MKVSFEAISFSFENSHIIQDKLIARVNHMLDVDISELMGIVPPSDTDPVIRGGAFDDVKDQVSPFGFEKCEGDPFLCSHLCCRRMHLFAGHPTRCMHSYKPMQSSERNQGNAESSELGRG